MSVFDELPPPPKSSKSSLKNPQTAKQFAVILNGFALVYHLLHKFIMPLVVIYSTNLPTQNLEKVDWWWVYHAILAYFLIKKKWQSRYLRFFVTFGFGGATAQILESIDGSHWHSVSLWLTALCTFVVTFYIYSLLPKLNSKKSMVYLIIGMLFGLLVEGSLYYFL